MVKTFLQSVYGSGHADDVAADYEEAATRNGLKLRVDVQRTSRPDLFYLYAVFRNGQKFRRPELASSLGTYLYGDENGDSGWPRPWGGDA
jgi:hypothetical protein